MNADSKTTQDSVRLTMPVRFLQIPKRARDACTTLGIHSVGEALDCSADRFATVPNCGHKSYSTFHRTVLRFLEAADDRVDFSNTDGFDDRLTSIALTNSTTRALGRAGVKTIGHFLTTPIDDHLLVRGIERAACEAVLEHILDSLVSPAGSILPPSLLEFEVHRLFLPDEVHAAFDATGITNLGDLLDGARAALERIGPEGTTAVRGEISRLFTLGLERFSDEINDDGRVFRAFYARLMANSSVANRELFERRIGFDGRTAESRWQISARSRVTEDEVKARELAFVTALHGHFGEVLERLRAQVDQEIDAFDGIVTGDRLAPGTILQSAVVAADGDLDFPLRLVAVLYPGEYFHHGSFLTEMNHSTFDELLAALSGLCRRAALPRPVEEIRKHLFDTLGYDVPPDHITHIARHHLDRAIQIDPELGELLTTHASTVAERLQLLLEQEDRPRTLSDLLFAYRDRHRRVHHGALRAHLRLDSRFLELGPGLWSLRDRHLDELEIARVEADRIRNVIRTMRGRHRVRDLSRDAEYSDRQVFVIADLLRHEPCIRDLGRNEFCPRFEDHSEVMMELLTALKRAAGEIPMDRFLSNQSPRRRRLVETLLRRNRAFVRPSQEHVDLITNYPFDKDRIRRLLRVVDQFLAEHGDYALESQVLEVVNSAGLGGSFLTTHLLLDLLYRHGRYEFLPGGIVASGNLGLTGWIQQKAREAIRAAEFGTLTSDEVLIESPELAEFGHCLRELLTRDPLIQEIEDDRFQVA